MGFFIPPIWKVKSKKRFVSLQNGLHSKISKTKMLNYKNLEIKILKKIFWKRSNFKNVENKNIDNNNNNLHQRYFFAYFIEKKEINNNLYIKFLFKLKNSRIYIFFKTLFHFSSMKWKISMNFFLIDENRFQELIQQFIFSTESLFYCGMFVYSTHFSSKWNISRLKSNFEKIYHGWC